MSPIYFDRVFQLMSIEDIMLVFNSFEYQNIQWEMRSNPLDQVSFRLAMCVQCRLMQKINKTFSRVPW